jgi:hypothetical protein
MSMMKIAASEISSVTVIEQSMNMVLLVQQRNMSHPLVVKGEDGKGRQNVGAMLEFHATAFSKLRAMPFQTERLSTQEIDELKKCDPSKIKLDPRPTPSQWHTKLDNLLYGKGDETVDKNKIKAVVKLSYIEELADVRGLADKEDKRRQLVSILEAGSREGLDAVFALGQILAVDFFIGNHDRFREGDGQIYPWTTDEQKVFVVRGAIIGDQNVFFSFRNGKIVPVGIDTFDSSPNNRWSDMGKTIESLEDKSDGKPWPGRILSRGAEKSRDAAASALVASLIALVNADVSARTRKNLVKSCHEGISSGKMILRAKYNLTDNLQALAEGIRSRWAIINSKS